MDASRLSTLCIAAAVAAAAVAVVGVQATERGQVALFRAFHLRPAHPAEFVALQVLPTMYVAHNRVWMSNAPIDWRQIEAQGLAGISYPHYPSTLVIRTVRGERERPCVRYAGIESRLRGRVFRTHLRIDATESGIRLGPAGPELPTCSP